MCLRSIVLKHHTNEVEFNLLLISSALLKPYNIMQIGRPFDKNVVWKKLERMSLWMDEYKSVPILDQQLEKKLPFWWWVSKSYYELQHSVHLKITLYVMQCFVRYRSTTYDIISKGYF